MRLDEKKYIFKQRMMNIIHNTLRDTWFKRVNSHAISLQLLIDAIGASDDVSIRIHYTNYQSYQIIVNKNVILIFDGDRRQITIIIAKKIAVMLIGLGYDRDNISITAIPKSIVDQIDTKYAIEQDAREYDQEMVDLLDLY